MSDFKKESFIFMKLTVEKKYTNTLRTWSALCAYPSRKIIKCCDADQITCACHDVRTKVLIISISSYEVLIPRQNGQIKGCSFPFKYVLVLKTAFYKRHGYTLEGAIDHSLVSI